MHTSELQCLVFQMYGAQGGEKMCWMKYRKEQGKMAKGREGGIGRDWGEGKKHMEERMEEGVLHVCVCVKRRRRGCWGEVEVRKTVWHSVNCGLMKVLIMELVTFQPVTDPVALIDPMWSVIRRHYWLATRSHCTPLPYWTTRWNTTNTCWW